MTACKVKQGMFFLAHFPILSDELFLADQTDHSDDERTVMTTLLLQFVLDTLHKCLLYDKGSFLTKSNFTALMKPLVDQVNLLKWCGSA